MPQKARLLACLFGLTAPGVPLAMGGAITPQLPRGQLRQMAQGGRVHFFLRDKEPHSKAQTGRFFGSGATIRAVL